jgi:hypothetical protein
MLEPYRRLSDAVYGEPVVVPPTAVARVIGLDPLDLQA